MTIDTAVKFTVKRLGEEDRPFLEEMYEQFAPHGVALGLPPVDPERRKVWLAELSRGMNFGAFAGDLLAGHLALLPTGDRAELVCFVHQDYRRRGIAWALAEAAVEAARPAGIKSIWVLVDNMNFAARRGLTKFGFRLTWEDQREAEFVYDLPEKNGA